MATFNSIFVPAGAAVTASVNTVTSTAEIILGKNAIFAINATTDFMIKFGNSGMAAAAATDFRIPAGTVAEFDLGNSYDRIRIFNNGGGSGTYWIQQLSKS